jgi:hypothetical protein
MSLSLKKPLTEFLKFISLIYMSTKEDKQKLQTRPLKNIDWDLVDRLLEAGNDGIKIAGYFGVHHDTFYNRFKEKHGVGFTEYCQRQHSKGEALILLAQYAKAIGATKKGDTALLTYLGKVRLKQREHDDKITPPNEKELQFADAYIKSEMEKKILLDKLAQYEKELNVSEPKANSFLLRSNEAVQHMGRSCTVGEDILKHPEASGSD